MKSQSVLIVLLAKTILSIYICCNITSCNTSTSLTNVANIQYDELQEFKLLTTSDRIIETCIDNKKELEQYLSTVNTKNDADIINNINFKKECLALIAYPQTDLVQYIQVEMLEQKADTLKLYYSLIQTNELASETYCPFKVIKLKKQHPHIQIIKK